ncbi:DciA family protein [Psychromonas sp. CD1]|uniref:DciA family protein n=1 Tax=Psychromonas sp. CD1 TaxID=1979839 RepID=UPI000B9A2DDD|nr:DciA family protein [Psychromonas sp. CD1]
MTRICQPKPIFSLLEKNSLQHDASLMTQLNILLQHHLKQHKIDGCRIGKLKNGSLLIEMPSALWQQRLQFIRNELLSALRIQYPALVSIKFRINPTLNIARKTKKRPLHKKIKPAARMPLDVADSFLALAENAEPGLKRALQSLAKYTKKE